MVRRPIFALWAILLCVVAVIPSTADALQPPADEDAASPQTEGTYADDQLLDELHRAGLTDDWLQAAAVSDEAALVLVVGNAGYLQARQAFLDDLEALAMRRAAVDERVASIGTVEKDVTTLEQLIRSLRRDLAATGRSPALSLADDRAAAAHDTLTAIAGTQRWLALSIDPLALAEHHLASVRDELSRVVEDLTETDRRSAKTPDVEVAQLTELHDDLQRVHRLIATAREASVRSQLEVASHRASAVALIPELHRQRLLSTSVVGGLPLVTLDAYVRGAEAVDASCSIEWNLLAGIGRVESRHGTIGGSVVQASGRVSNSILGPLLDGGATAREAAAAAAAAQAAVLAEAEAAEAEVAEEEVEAVTFDATVWGDDTLDRAEQLRESTDGSEAVGLAAPPVVAEVVAQPRYDPLLWGDDLPFDDDDDFAADDDGDSDGQADATDDDGDEPKFRGNGFAVIHDSDNGVYDGNSRWDRAVGPMQFIPETWSYWATDGNGDGATDPQNLYDAAAGAGRFLCHLSRTRGASPYTFVLGYNSSDIYVRNVMAVADAFGASELPTLES